MAALFHFGFELIRIGILSSIYSLLIILIILLINKFTSRQFRNKRRLWKILTSIIYSLLFVFMFTYWGDHGLGDEAYIPIGNDKTVNQIDGAENYLEKKSGEQLSIKDFAFDKDYLYTELQDDPKYNYAIWDLKTDQWRFYINQFDLEKAIGKTIAFEDFWIYYNNYWNGWRFWLLP